MKQEYDFSKGQRGAVIPQTGRTRVALYIDDDLLETLRERADNAGHGYQDMVNEALREYLNKTSAPITIDEETLRRVIREELKAIR